MRNLNRAFFVTLGLVSAACGGGGEGDAGLGGAGNRGEGCSVKDNGDGTGTVTCGDGTTAEITGVPGADCTAEDNGNGSWVLTCGDSDPVTVQQTAAFKARIVVQDAGDLYVLSTVGNGAPVLRERINAPFTEAGGQLLGGYEVSSDNKHVLFIARASTTAPYQVYVSNVSKKPTKPVRVNGALAASGAVTQAHFSPDGSKIGYIATEDNATTSELYVVSVAAGEVSDHAKVSGTTVLGRTVSSFRFSADASKIAFLSDTAIGSYPDLYVAAADDSADPGKVNGTLVVTTQVADTYSFSPDGNRLAYAAQQGVATLNELYVAVLDGADPETADKVNGTLDGTPVGLFGFSPDSKRLAYLADEDVAVTANVNLFVSDVTGDSPGTGEKVDDANYDSGNVTAFSFTSSGKYLVFQGDLRALDEIEVFSSDVSKAAPGAQKALNPDLVTGGGVSSFQVVPETDNVVFTGFIRSVTSSELFLNGASAADDAAVLNATLATNKSVTGFTLARNGTALTYLASVGSTGASVFRVKLGKAPSAAELIANPSLPAAGVASAISNATPSQDGKLVGFSDLYGYTDVADGVAPPVAFGAPLPFQFLH